MLDGRGTSFGLLNLTRIFCRTLELFDTICGSLNVELALHFWTAAWMWRGHSFLSDHAATSIRLSLSPYVCTFLVCLLRTLCFMRIVCLMYCLYI